MEVLVRAAPSSVDRREQHEHLLCVFAVSRGRRSCWIFLYLLSFSFVFLIDHFF